MKPPFEELNYRDDIHWLPINGNNIGFIAPLARIIHNADAVKEAYQKKYNKAKETYEKHINCGQLFKSETGRVIAEITSVNHKTKTVSWKQINIEEFPEALIPAKAKWSILGMIYMIESKQIILL